MGWDQIALLIIQVGLPLAEKIWQKATSGAPVSQADWDELNALAKQTPVTQMQDALTRAGIVLTDPKAVELLKLVATPPPA